MNSAPDASTEADRAKASAAGQDLLQALSQAIGRLGQIEVNDENSLQRVFRDINETACALVGLERCVIWCVDGGDVMRCADRYDALTRTHSGGEHADFAEIGEPEAFVDSQFAVFDDLHTVSSDGKPIAELLISFGVRACIVARIWVDGAIAGYLTLCRTSGPHAWQAGEAAVAEVLATLAGKSLEAAARHDAMRSLRVERARVQSFAELASDCFWETDADGRFSMLSPGAEAVFCQETASLLARTPWEALKGEKVDMQALQVALQARRPLKNAQLTLAGAEGEPRLLRLDGCPVYDADGRFLGFRGAVRDMTDALAGEQRLRNHLEAMERRSMTGARERIELDRVFRDTVKLAARSMRSVFPSFWLWNEAGRMLSCAACYDQDNDGFIELGVAQLNRIDPDAGYQGRHGVQLLVLDAEDWSDQVPASLLERLRHWGIRSLLNALLWRNGRFVGLLSMCHCEPDRTWTATDRLIAQSLGNHLLRSLEAHELQITRDALETSESRFRDFAEATSDWFWATGPDHRFTFVSEQHQVSTGLRTADLMGRTRWNFHVHNENDPKWRRHIATLARRRPFRDFRFSFVPADGRPRHITISGKPVFTESGEFLGYRGAGRDITATEEAKAAVTRSRDLFLAALEDSPSAIQLIDENDRVVYCNRRYRAGVDDVYGIDSVGMAFEDLLNALVDYGHIPEAIGREEAWMEERMQRHRDPRGVIEVRRGRGGEFSVAIHERRIAGGATLLTFVDIAATQDRLETLALSEARYRDFASVSCDWVWETDEEHRFTYLVGCGDLREFFEQRDYAGKTRWEVLDQVDESFEWRRHRADLNARRPFNNLRLRYRFPDGDIAGVSVSGAPWYDECGTFRGYRGIGRLLEDTARPDRIGHQLSELMGSLLDQFPAGIAIVDAADRIEYCNPRFRRLCIELLALDPLDCDFGAFLERVVANGRADERLGLSAEDLRCRLQRQHAARGGYIGLDFGGGPVRYVDLIEFAAPGERVFVCLNDSTTETAQMLEAEQVLRQRLIRAPLMSMAGLLAPALQAFDAIAPGDHPDIASMRRLAGRLGLLADMTRQAPREIDLAEWLDQEKSELQSVLMPGQRLEFIGLDTPAPCDVDPVRLKAALTEILRNAAEACEGPAAVTMRLSPAADRSPGSGGHVCGHFVRLSVLDSGPGIEPGLRGRIVQPFVGLFGGDAGRGLGLTIADCFADLAGGCLAIADRAGQGTTVELYLPAAVANIHRAEAAD